MKDTRTQILDAAKKVFSEKGFYESTMDEIAKEAGVAKGTTYLYFKSKIELYIAVIEREFNVLYSMLKEITGGVQKVEEKIEAMVELFLSFLEKNKKFFTTMIFEPPVIRDREIREKHRKKAEMIHECIEHVIKEGVEKGVIINEKPDLIVDVVLGTIIRPAFHFLIKGEKGSLQDLKEPVCKIVKNGILKKRRSINA